MKFIIEQVALCPADSERARALLGALGLDAWAEDTVRATGLVRGKLSSNVAELAFNYQASADNKPLELEVLKYTHGDNWMQHRPPSVSHLGMHCTAEELVEWRERFSQLGVNVVQDVATTSHTNPAILGKRRYNYVIFDTREILGVDLKFIVRWSNS